MEMNLISTSDDFHMFETEVGVAGVSFAMRDEGLAFQHAVNERIKKRNQRRLAFHLI